MGLDTRLGEEEYHPLCLHILLVRRQVSDVAAHVTPDTLTPNTYS
jgi:hypothetical protein